MGNEKKKAPTEKRDPKGVADRLVSRVTSRKLLVWATGTYLCLVGTLEGGDWVAISLAYLGSQALVDIAAVAAFVGVPGLGGEQLQEIFMAYIGGQAMVDASAAFKNG